MKNEFSHEQVTLYLSKSAGNLDRFVGLCMAMSSNMSPISLKVACFKEELFDKGINQKLLADIIKSNNTIWGNDMLIIEESQKHLFFSDKILS